MKKTSLKPLLLAVAAAATLAAGGAQAQSWTRYDYVATVDANTDIGGAMFAAGSQVTGEVFVRNGITPTNGGWGYANEVAVYNDAVTLFTFHHASLDTAAVGEGNAQVNNNRRLTRSGGSWQDVFGASLTTEPTTQFLPTQVGDGVSGLMFELRSPFMGAPAATTSLALPQLVNVPLFSGQNDLRLSFANSMFVDATIVQMTASQVTAVPEPSTFALAGLGLAALGLARRRQPGAAR